MKSSRSMRLLARFNRHVTNRAFRCMAARIPGYANVVHTGRRSGDRYRTPVGITWHHNEVRIALNYGSRSDWVRNVLAAGGLELEHRGRIATFTQPRIDRISGRDFLTAAIPRGRSAG